MSQPRFDHDAIAPLVSHKRAQGRHLMVTFTCPVSGTHVQSRWAAPQSSGVGSAVARQAKSSLVYEVRRQVLVMIRQTLGYSFAGRMATTAASTAMNNLPGTTSGAPSLSAGQQDEGLVEAFKAVAGQFAWAGDRWVHRTAAGQVQGKMDAQLSSAPVTSGYDRLLLARMMVEVAAAHGGISAEEQGHLAEVIDPDLGSLQSLMDRPPLTGAELAEASEGPVRQTLLGAVWSLALCDQHEDQAELALLTRFADALGVDAAAARRLAQEYVMDQAFERAFAYGGHDRAARQQLVALGERIGMTRAEVERAEARYQKRRLG